MSYSGNVPNLPLSEPVPQPVDLTSTADTSAVRPIPFVQPDPNPSNQNTGGESLNNEGNGTTSQSQGELSPSSDTSDILRLFSSLANSDTLADYVNSFHSIFDNIDESLRFKWSSIDASAKMQLIQNAMDKAYSLAAKQFDIDYTYKMWLMQQEYNSPKAQLERLNEAGLGGMYSSVTSNMAQSSPASSTSGDSSGSSSTPIGNLQQAADASKRQSRAQWAQVAISAATGIINGYSTLAQLPSGIAQMRSAAALNNAQVARLDQMTPLEVDNVFRSNQLLDTQVKKEGKAIEGLELQNIYQSQVNDFYQSKIQSEINVANENSRLMRTQADNFDRELGIREEANRVGHEANRVSSANARLSADVQREGFRNAYDIASLGEEESEVLVDSKTGFSLGAELSAQVLKFASVNADGSYTYGGMTLSKQRQKRIVPSANMKKMNPSAVASLLKDLNTDQRSAYVDKISKSAGKAMSQHFDGLHVPDTGYQPNNFMSYGSANQ